MVYIFRRLNLMDLSIYYINLINITEFTCNFSWLLNTNYYFFMHVFYNFIPACCIFKTIFETAEIFSMMSRLNFLKTTNTLWDTILDCREKQRFCFDYAENENKGAQWWKFCYFFGTAKKNIFFDSTINLYSMSFRVCMLDVRDFSVHGEVSNWINFYYLYTYVIGL